MTAVAIPGRGRIGPQVTVIVAALAAVGLAAGPAPELGAGIFGGGLAITAWHRRILSWRILSLGFVVATMLIPARAYRLPISLPFQMEPYRIAILLFAAVLLVQRATTGRILHERPRFAVLLLGVMGTSLFSAAANAAFIHDAGLMSDVVGAVLSLLVVGLGFWVVVLTIRSMDDVHCLLMLLVTAGVVVAVFAAVEAWTGFNVFTHLGSVLPFRFTGEAEPFLRQGRIRAVASGQHPLALAAEMAMLVPIAAYMAVRGTWPGTARGRQMVWGSAGLVLVVGMLAAGSRTGIVVLFVAIVVCVRLRPASARAMWAIVPVVVVGALLAPSSVASVVEAFSPSKGLIAEQNASAGGRGSGRLADISPAFSTIGDRPLFGRGFGTRRTEAGQKAAEGPQILDNQYLSRAIDTGVLGLLSVLALVLVPLGAMWRVARRRTGERADLAALLTCILAAYAVSLFFYDGFAFFQPMLTFLMLLAIGAWLLRPVPNLASGPMVAPAQRPLTLVSVIMPVLNAAGTIGEQLEGLARQCFDGNWELIVADNGSVDATMEIVDRFGGLLPLRTVDARLAVGPGAVRNLAAAGCRGELLVFCDADDVVSPSWLAALVCRARDADLVGGCIDENDLNAKHVRQWRPAQQPGGTLASPGGYLPFASSANLAVWSDVFFHLDGFRSGGFSHEDVDLCWRAQLRRFTLLYAPDAVVHYRHRRTLRALAGQSYQYGKGSVVLYRRFRAHGLRREPVRVVLGSWRAIATRVPDLWADRGRQGAYVQMAATRAGRLVSSVQHGTLFL